MVHGKDFFIEVYNGGTNQENVGIGVSYVKHSNSELVMTSVNGLKSLNVKVYYISNRAIPSPSSFLKSVDFTIASGTATKIFYFQILQMLARLFAPVSYLVDGKVGTLLM